MKEYEKLISFSLILGAICWLAWMASGEQTFVMVDGKPISVASGSPLRDVLIGLIGVLGMAGQALFRTSETAGAMNDLLKDMASQLGKSIPHTPQEPNTTTTTTSNTDEPLAVVIEQPADSPVPVEEHSK